MRISAALLLCLSLAACGGLYSSPQVQPGETAAGDVQIIPITAANIAAANSSPYRPRTLPAVFGQSAGTWGTARGAGSLPAPAFSAEARPASLPTRLPPAFVPGSYLIGVGDVVLLSTPTGANTVEALTGLLAAQSQRQGYTVQEDNAIAVPGIGRIRIGGLTLEEAEAEVFQSLVGNQLDPTFSLEIAEFNSQRVVLGGSVQKPATVPITLNPLSLSAALTATGGLTVKDDDYASIRLYRDGNLYQIPLSEYLKTPNLQKLVLKDGDAVYVDTAFDLDKAEGYFAQQIQIATLRQSTRTAAITQLETEIGLRRSELAERRDNFRAQVDLDAVERDYVYVAGEVGLQNRFTLPFNSKASLADALFDRSEGVPNRTGNVSELYVLRASNDGTGVSAWHLNAVNAANLILATQFELRPNDIVFVAEQPVTTLDRLVSQIAPSIALAQAL